MQSSSDEYVILPVPNTSTADMTHTPTSHVLHFNKLHLLLYSHQRFGLIPPSFKPVLTFITNIASRLCQSSYTASSYELSFSSSLRSVALRCTSQSSQSEHSPSILPSPLCSAHALCCDLVYTISEGRCTYANPRHFITTILYLSPSGPRTAHVCSWLPLVFSLSSTHRPKEAFGRTLAPRLPPFKMI